MNAQRMEPGMLWQSYRAALSRNEYETAANRLHAYLQQQVTRENAVPTALPLSMSCAQEYKLYEIDVLSKAFDEYSPHGWVLSQQPVDLLTILQQHHMSSINKQFKAGNDDPEVCSRAVVLIQCLCGLVSSVNNYTAMVSNGVTSSVLSLAQSCLHIVMSCDVATPSADLLTIISHCVIYFHLFYDPNRKWKSQFVQHLANQPVIAVKVSPLDSNLSDFFIRLFDSMGGAGEGVASEDMMNIQYEMLHMFGAVMAGSKGPLLISYCVYMDKLMRNARMLLNGKTSALLFTLFRDTLTIRETAFTRVQAVGARVIARAVVVAYNWRNQVADLEKPVTVDVHVLLYGVMHSLDPCKNKDTSDSSPLSAVDIVPVCLLLDTMPMITDYRSHSRRRLQEQLINAKCFTNIMSSMATIAEISSKIKEEGSKILEQLCCSCLRAVTAILRDNGNAKDVFVSVVGYSQLATTVRKLCPINQTIMKEFLVMSFDGYIAEQMVFNAHALAMLHDCFYHLPSSDQLWLLDKLLDIVKRNVHNQQKCCQGGLICHLLSLLAQYHHGDQQLSTEAIGKLIELLEVLASHSISSVELKMFLRLLTPNKEGQLPTHSLVLQKTLLNMTMKDTRNLPLNTIDLTAMESEIKLEKPLNMKLVGGGFTFHAWIYLSPPLSLETPGALRKRMLYYFGTPNGAGFQAFFRNSGTLVVATVTKRGEFINLCLQDCPLTHSAWHSICIVHLLTHRLWSHSEVSVFIDGRLIRTEKMKGPESQEFPEAYIGCGPPIKGESEEDIRMEELLCNITGEMYDLDDSVSESYGLNLSPALPVETKSIQSAKEQYGVEGILRGFLCSACLFSECLSAPVIASIVYKGPNDLSLFQPRKANSLHEVASKLMFYYHAKACHDNRCPDLSPLHIPGSTLNASIQALVYSSWEVKSVLRSLGGAKLLIPLLEYASLPYVGETDGSLGVSLFLQLLHTFLDEHNQNLFLLNDGIAIVGALMEEVPADKLTVATLNAVQSLLELAECSVQRNFVMDIYRHLIFNFYIWSRADYSVQSGHVQFVSTIVKDNLFLCSKDYGVQFMLNTIQSFYCTGCKEPSRLEDEQQRSIAAALFSNIKLYLQRGIKTEDVKALLAAVLSTESFDIQEEILRLLLHMLKTSDHASVLGHLLMSEGTPLLALLRSRSNSVSQTVTNIMLNLYKKFSANEGKLSASFKDGTFATAMVQMLRHQHAISSNILLSVLEMCTEKSLENFTDYIVNLELCMALLQLLRIADNQVKTTICQQLISLLQLNPAHAVEIARRPAWEMVFLWLLITDDTPVTTPLGPSYHAGSNESDHTEDSFTDGFEVVSLPFSARTSSDNKKNTASDDKERLLNTVVEVMGLIVWEEAIDIIVTDEMYLKHAWCRLFTAVRDFTDKHHAIFSSNILLQKLLHFVLQIVHVTCSGSGHDTPNFITIVSTILELFEFYCTSYSSHVPKLNDGICSIQLLECYINLMRTLGLFAGLCTDIMVIRFTLRLLIACLTTENKQYSVIGVSRLEELLQCSSQHLQANDICYLLHVLFSILQGVHLTGEVESEHYLVLAIKTLFIHSPDSFDTSKLSLLPDPLSNPNFTDDFMTYILQDEWNHFMAYSVIPGSLAFWEEHISPLQARWYDLVKLCGQMLEERDARRLQHKAQQNNKYQEQVLDVFFEKREVVREHFASDCFSHYVNKRNIAEQWNDIKRSMTGEQGVWNVDDETPRQFTLQVDPTENFSRMRMRLIPDYVSGRHEDASHMRDEGHSEVTAVSTDPIEHSLLREARALRHTYSISSDTSEFLFLLTDDELLSSPYKNKSGEEHSEKRIKTVECQFITLVDFTPGMLHITTHNLHFVPESFTTGVKEFKISVKDIREIHSRRYHLVRSALELFLVDQTNYFFNFLSKKASTKVYGCITSLHTPNLIYSGIIQPHKLLQASGLTHKWVRHQISNFDYIMQLNTLSGRTYNDLNQYPVFPWVLCDYESETIDLNDHTVYRDLSKPLGIINPNFEPLVRERYEEFEDPSGEIEKFHYGTHYSNAAGVMHYLIRLEPFTSQHISLQSGKFDHSDRQFFSVSNTWSAISTSMSDVKELIPEFYYLPEFLINVNKFDLGKLQDKSRVEDVILPKWAKDAYDFVHINRQALESDYVSQHLHEWVNLIWGYKQRGEEAVKACNVFYYCTYEGSVDLTSVTNEKKRKQLESMINNFGQTPTQLFFEPHPQRLSLEEARKSLAGKFSVSGQKSALSIFENLKELKAFSIEVNSEPLVSVSSPTVKLETIIASGNPEHVLTVTNTGLVNKHDWLPFSLSRNKSFTFTLDHNMHLDRSQWQFLGAPFSSSVPITDNLFVSSACNNLLVSAGHWDCSFRVHNLVKGKTVRRISHHTDIVSCLALDKPGERLITGSRDTTCAIWQFSSQNHNCSKPLQILYGHNAEIICIDASVELDTVVSGAKDGTCIIHSLRKGEYMHSLQANHKAPSKVTHISIGPSSARVVACYQLMQEKRQRLTWLHLFTINGQLLKTLEVEQTITGLIVTDNHFITSSIEMKLIFGHLHNLKQVSSLKLQSPVYSLSLTYQSTHLLVGLADGKLVIVTSIK